jgi:hypothetical protein
MLLRIVTMEHRSRRGEWLERRNMTLCTLLPPTVIPPSCGLFISFLTSTRSHRRHGCMNGKSPIFYNMLVGEWQTTSAWTDLTWQHYKGELLRTRGLNVMSIAEYHSATQMEIFPFYHWTCVVWLVWYRSYLYLNYLYLNYQLTYARLESMHNYKLLIRCGI